VFLVSKKEQNIEKSIQPGDLPFSPGDLPFADEVRVYGASMWVLLYFMFPLENLKITNDILTIRRVLLYFARLIFRDIFLIPSKYMLDQLQNSNIQILIQTLLQSIY